MNLKAFVIILLKKYILCQITKYRQIFDECDISLNNIYSIETQSLDECWFKCLENMQCYVFTFNKETKYCSFKQIENDISEMAVYNSIMVLGIIDKKCSNLDDFTPNLLNCSKYFGCINEIMTSFECQRDFYFDPFVKKCIQDSSCFYGCNGISKSNVSVINSESNYFDCSSQSLEQCSKDEIYIPEERHCRKIYQNIILKIDSDFLNSPKCKEISFIISDLSCISLESDQTTVQFQMVASPNKLDQNIAINYNSEDIPVFNY
ncbi:unnamed protein product [Brachionus calyciflorus]|uniref:Apple domain-containing protein n=1 Tax=Brachionus calyciflorus TaxID=104777 RepID=A0A814EH85_9BILA|nr:unnamed protein product [Brachionus calyciflorus]